MEIPGYRAITEIGRGSASIVYRAEQEQFGRTVAVKVLSVGVVEDRLRRRFERECAATGRLTGHPNIVAVLDNGYTADGNPYIATAYYAHGSLGDRLAQDGPLPLDDVLRIVVKVSGALEAVHHGEILHRDIKPSNLLESGYGEPALTGFGISAIDPSQQAMTMAQSFAPVHTPPEVVLGQQASEASDTYQLASTLYTLLAGHAPFETGDDDGIFAMLGRIQDDPVPPIDRPDVPATVIEVLQEAMAKRPEDRFSSSARFGERLQQLQGELGLPVTDLVMVAGAPAPDAGAGPTEHTVLIPAMSTAVADVPAPLIDPSPPVPPQPAPPVPTTPDPPSVAPAAPAPPPVAPTAPPAAPAAAAPAPAPLVGPPVTAYDPMTPAPPVGPHAVPSPTTPIPGGPITGPEPPPSGGKRTMVAIIAVLAAVVIALIVVAVIVLG